MPETPTRQKVTTGHNIETSSSLNMMEFHHIKKEVSLLMIPE